MLEMKITIAVPELSAAVNNLAAALEGKSAVTAAKAVTTVPAVPSVPADPIAAPVATPARMVPPVAPTIPVAASVPAVTPAADAAPVADTVPVPGVPTAAPQYTLEMIATAGSALLDAGKMEQLMQLLGRFGVVSLTELAPESYGAVANELRAMGAAI